MNRSSPLRYFSKLEAGSGNHACGGGFVPDAGGPLPEIPAGKAGAILGTPFVNGLRVMLSSERLGWRLAGKEQEGRVWSLVTTRRCCSTAKDRRWDGLAPPSGGSKPRPTGRSNPAVTWDEAGPPARGTRSRPRTEKDPLGPAAALAAAGLHHSALHPHGRQLQRLAARRRPRQPPRARRPRCAAVAPPVP